MSGWPYLAGTISTKGRRSVRRGKEREMFEKFGEMGSWQELNELAKNLMKEGDMESLQVFCKENGLDIEDIKDAAADGVELFVTPTTAAAGRLKAEEESDGSTPKCLYTMARMIAADPHNAPMFVKKGKNVKGVFKKLEDIARKNKSGSVGVACGTDRELAEIIMNYYQDKEAAK